MTINVDNKYTATIKTTMGDIVIELFPKQTPVTANNFVFLARDGFYDGLIFHRVIEQFMIQGGDPLGSGIGGPGYRMAYEIVPDLIFDKPGYLATAGTPTEASGSQFFITTVATPHLNGNHTIFGRVVEGQDVAEAISKVSKDARDKPLQEVAIETVTITETPAG